VANVNYPFPPETTMKTLTSIVFAAILIVSVGASSGCNPAANPAHNKPTAKVPEAVATADDAEAVPPPAAVELSKAENRREEAEETVKKPSSKKDLAAKKPIATKRLSNKATPAAGGRAEPGYLAGVPLIGREALFGNPNRASARISPDGTQLAYLAPVDGVLNVWVGPLANPNRARPVTHDKVRGIRIYHWAFTSQHVLYLQDVGGDEDWHVYSVDLAAGETKDLTPLEKVNAQISQVSHRFPEEILVALNDRNPEFHDLYRVNLVTGKRELVEKNTQCFAGYVCDDDYRVRFAQRFVSDGGNELLVADGRGGWDDFLKIPAEDTLTTAPLGFDKSGDVLFLTDSRQRNTGALVAWDLKTGKRRVLAESDQADVGEVLSHPTENTIEAVAPSNGR
jgi:hypothetical protein